MLDQPSNYHLHLDGASSVASITGRNRMRLSQYVGTRDNNFNLLRLIAAFLVLVSHSYPLSALRLAEPLRESLGVTWGSIAVDVFFVSSGFLVTASLLQRKSVKDFSLARALRIFPGLWVAMLVTVVAASLFLSNLGVADFWHDKQTWKYLLKNCFLARGVEFTLPGTLQGLHGDPQPAALNGSLWTLPVEVRMYALLAVCYAVIGALLRGATDSTRTRALHIAITAGAVTACVANLFVSADKREGTELSLLAMFFAGSFFYVHRERIEMSWAIFTSMVLLVLASTLFGAAPFGLAYYLLVPYLVLFAAYVPAGPIRHYNRLGDYSYGVYIYAFPVQQFWAYEWRTIGFMQMLVAATLTTLPLAVLSWKLVEERALRLKPKPEVASAKVRNLAVMALDSAAYAGAVVFAVLLFLGSSWSASAIEFVRSAVFSG